MRVREPVFSRPLAFAPRMRRSDRNICSAGRCASPAVFQRPRPSGGLQGLLRTRVVLCFFDDTVLTQSPNSQGHHITALVCRG